MTRLQIYGMAAQLTVLAVFAVVLRLLVFIGMTATQH
jgi:hypothetical protein